MERLKLLLLPVLLTLLINSSVSAQATMTVTVGGSISGQVADSLGAVIAGAKITVIDAGAKQKGVITNKQGEFTINGLAPGKYMIRVTAPKFGLYENSDVEIKAGEKQELTIVLAVDSIKEEVQVNSDTGVSIEADSNISATVLKGKDLDDLPDNPDDLESYLQALAGPAAGPEGGQIYIDGFTGGRLPPKEAIREIRINSNPFSAEYDRIGFGRIEIFTKAGYDKFRGSANFNFNNQNFNSRNPFALNRAPSRRIDYGGYLSGPIIKKKASFFLDFNNRTIDNNAVITATILDPAFNIIDFNQDVSVPTRRFTISPRIDYQISKKNSLVARYSFTRNISENQGVGGFSLASREYNSSTTQHNIQLTETFIINPKTVNETRFQYELNNRQQNGSDPVPTINVASAFTGGGAQIGLSYNDSKRWEFQNYTTTASGKNFAHSVKFGIRARGISIEDRSESGYAGTFTFAGVRNPLTGDILYSSIEQYRQKVLGNPDPIFNPSQFSLTAGNPLAGVSQIDYALFFADDWRARRNLTLSFGLRYENQNNIHDNLNFAPRFGFAYALGSRGNSRKPAKTVFRGGFGIFYDRFGENFTLRARHNDGVSQLRYVVADSNLLGQAIFTGSGVTNVPTVAQLASVVPLSSIPYRISGELQTPYSIQTALSVERSLPYRSTVAATLLLSRNLHTLRQRNINAPVCPSAQVCPMTLTSQQIQLLRPDPTSGNIYQVESSGCSNTQQVLVRFNTRLNPRVTMFVNYTLSFAHGTTDSLSGANVSGNVANFPAYNYDLSGEDAPSSFIARNSLFVSGTFRAPWGFRMTPTVIASTGRRFNIITGLDTNRDSVFTERPTYAALNARCQAFGLTEPFCNTGGIANPDTTIIPRNYGAAPGSFVVNMNLSKTFGFGTAKPTVQTNRRGGGEDNSQTGRNNPLGGRQSGGGDGRGGGGRSGSFGAGDSTKPYNLTFGVSVQNLLNTVNLTSLQGNLSSPFFGRATSTGGNFGAFGGGAGSANRRIELSLRFSF